MAYCAILIFFCPSSRAIVLRPFLITILIRAIGLVFHFANQNYLGGTTLARNFHCLVMRPNESIEALDLRCVVITMLQDADNWLHYTVLMPRLVRRFSLRHLIAVVRILCAWWLGAFKNDVLEYTHFAKFSCTLYKVYHLWFLTCQWQILQFKLHICMKVRLASKNEGAEKFVIKKTKTGILRFLGCVKRGSSRMSRFSPFSNFGTEN